MAGISKEALVEIFSKVKTVTDQKVDIASGQAEGKYLQTNSNGNAVWGDAPSEAIIRDEVSDWLEDNVTTSNNYIEVVKNLNTENAAAESKTVGDTINAIVKVQSSQPTDPNNQIWIDNNASTDTLVPTMDELQDVQDMIAAEYSTANTYAVGAHVIHSGNLYVCKTAITEAEEWTAAHWTLVKVCGEIESLKSALNNVYDPSTATTGKALNKYGSPTDLDLGFFTDFIDVLPGMKVVHNLSLGSSYYYHIIYNANKQMIDQYKSNNDNFKLTMPENARYIRLSGNVNNVNSSYVYVHLEDVVVDLKIDYDETKAEVDSIKGNVQDINRGFDFFELNYTSDGVAIRYSDGAVVTQESCFITDYIPVYPGAKIKINQHLNSTTYANVFYYADRSIQSKVYCNADGTNLTVPSGAAYLRACGVLANKSDMKVLVYESPLPYFNIVDAFEKYLLLDKNVFNSLAVSEDVAIRTSDWGVVTLSGCYVSNYIPVIPGEVYRIENNYGSYYYGTGFYKRSANGYSPVNGGVNSIGDYNGVVGYKYVVVPETAEFMRITGATAKISTQKVTHCRFIGKDTVDYLNTKANTINLYDKVILKGIKDTIDGYDHAAFPSSVFFAGKQVVAARLGTQHHTPSSSSEYGGIKFFVQEPTGEWSHSRSLLTSADFTGLNGELRDPNLGITKDGQYLILASWTTYQSNEIDVHDAIIATFNSNLEIVSYKVFVNATNLFWGNPLITPNGNLMVGSYTTTATVNVNISTAEFNPTNLNSLEFITVQIHNSGSEVTLGYVGEKLYALMRTGSGGYLTYTSNLEGVNGWQTPVRYGNEVDAPVLPLVQPDNGKMFFGGAYYVNGSTRYPCIGYIDTTTHEMIASGNVDTDVTGYSGYCGIVPFGGNDYGVVYYEDGGTYAGLYYKRINAGYVISGMQYLV